MVRDGEPERQNGTISSTTRAQRRPAPPRTASLTAFPLRAPSTSTPTSLFVGRESEAETQARQVGYAALAVVLLLALFRIVGAFLTFFVSFTFSFLAIFALSAGLFVVFVLFRFF